MNITQLQKVWFKKTKPYLLQGETAAFAQQYHTFCHVALVQVRFQEPFPRVAIMLSMPFCLSLFPLFYDIDRQTFFLYLFSIYSFFANFAPNQKEIFIKAAWARYALWTKKHY